MYVKFLSMNIIYPITQNKVKNNIKLAAADQLLSKDRRGLDFFVCLGTGWLASEGDDLRVWRDS